MFPAVERMPTNAMFWITVSNSRSSFLLTPDTNHLCRHLEVPRAKIFRVVHIKLHNLSVLTTGSNLNCYRTQISVFIVVKIEIYLFIDFSSHPFLHFHPHRHRIPHLSCNLSISISYSLPNYLFWAIRLFIHSPAVFSARMYLVSPWSECFVFRKFHWNAN